MSNWNKIFKPIVVLCIICIVITGALAATNSVTAPIIEAATIAAQNAARQELAPEATAFEQIQGISVENVSDIYMGDNGEAVITCAGKGYGGTVTVMVAFTTEGTIKQIKVTEQAETQGLGTKVTADASYWTRYEGLEAKPLTLSSASAAHEGAPQVPQSRPGSLSRISRFCAIFLIASGTVSASFITSVA